jgi:hypothetical protein
MTEMNGFTKKRDEECRNARTGIEVDIKKLIEEAE